MAMAGLLAAATAQPDEKALVEQAGAVGTILFGLDRAAWVSTDAMLEKVDRSKLTGGGGYVVERIDGGRLRVTYYRGSGAAARAFFVADVDGLEMAEQKLLDTPVPLTPGQAALATARETAIAARRYRPCTPAPFNIIVAPAGRDTTLIYLMSAQVKADEVPMGGHYRLVLSNDGRILSDRPFSRTCLNMALRPGPDGKAPAAMVVNSVLDAVPTELHVFSSYAVRLPLYVLTADGRQWRVTGRRIELVPGRPLTPPAARATPPAT